MNTPPAFKVTLHHLAPDAKKAGHELADVQLPAMTSPQLRVLLEALAELAPKVEYPAAPEIRIGASDGQFLIQVREGHVRFSSWSVRAGGSDLTPAQIVAAITGREPAAADSKYTLEMTGVFKRPRRAWQLVLLVVGIVASNGVTAWLLTRPPPDFLPKYRLLDAEPSKRLLAGVAGTYETGSAEGDRQLRIDKEGGVHWVRFGPKRTVIEESTMTVQGAETAGRSALLTNTRGLIEIKDLLTIIFYGDTYRRTQT